MKKELVPQIKVSKKSETLQFHFHPKVVQNNLKDLVEFYKKENAEQNLIFLFEDIQKLVDFAVGKIAPKK